MAQQAAENPLRDKLIKGIELQRSGEFEKAQRCYKQVLKKAPQNADALHLLGVSYRQLGFPMRAIEYIQKALKAKPNQSVFYANLARAMLDIGTDAESLLAVTDKALACNPMEKEALNIRGIALGKLKRNEDAEEIFQRLIVRFPDFGDAYRNYGHLLRDAKQHDKALAFFYKALLLEPNNPKNYVERARCRLEMKDFDTSQGELAEALERFPDDPDLKHEAARLLFSVSRTHEGVRFAEEAVAANPSDYHAQVTLAVSYLMLGRGQDTIDTILNAKKLAPESAVSGLDWNLSLAYLSVGELEKGWDLHEARFTDRKAASKPVEFAKPKWQGEDISDKTVFVWGDQGLGDALKSSTMLPDLAARCRKVIFAASGKAIDFMRPSFPDIELIEHVPAKGGLETIDIDYDVTANITDLAGHFRRDIESFRTARSPVYTFDKERTKAYLSQIKGAQDKPVIGFAWRSKNLEKYRSRYYLSAPDFFPILESHDAVFVNLQYKAVAKELDYFRARLGDRFHHFEDVDLFDDLLAAGDLTAACDLVVSANTSVADLAGVLGVPCVRFGPVEPPLLLGESSPPWYPAMKYVYIDESRLTSEITPDIAAAMKDELSRIYPHARNERLG